MSNKELDNLFKVKLKDLEKNPSASAWDKIQAQNNTKKVAWTWMRVAASILLLFTIGAAVWLIGFNTPPETNLSASRIEPAQKNNIENTDEINNTQPDGIKKIKDNTQEVKEEPVVPQHSVKQKPFEKNTVLREPHEEKLLAQNESQKLEKNTEEVNVKTIDNLSVEIKIASNNVPDATIDKINASTEQEPEVTGQTIEINLEEFSKTAVAVNDQQKENKEKSEEKGLNKVLSIMKEIKSEAGIGDLRAAKNEILAFNFKKQEDEDSK